MTRAAVRYATFYRYKFGTKFKFHVVHTKFFFIYTYIFMYFFIFQTKGN